MASWLAEPAAMGALEFISPDANLVAAFVMKDMGVVVDELFELIGRGEREHSKKSWPSSSAKPASTSGRTWPTRWAASSPWRSTARCCRPLVEGRRRGLRPGAPGPDAGVARRPDQPGEPRTTAASRPGSRSPARSWPGASTSTCSRALGSRRALRLRRRLPAGRALARPAGPHACRTGRRGSR